MKKKILFPFLKFFSFIIILFCISGNVSAQTAENSFTISGGKYGSGTTFVLPHISKMEDQARYTGGFFKTQSDQTGAVHLFTTMIYNGKEIMCEVIIELSFSNSPGKFSFDPKEEHPPLPSASISISVGHDDEGGVHINSGSSGSVIVTGYSGPGGYIIGTFSGSFCHFTTPPEGSDEQPRIDQTYQVSGHFKGYHDPLHY